MKRLIARFFLKLFGWKIHSVIPPGTRKAVIIAAPHTSNFDFFIGRFAYWAMGVKIKFLIKKEAFTFPLGGLLRWSGGIPVDRSRNNRMVDQITKIFRESESFFVMITPEGTRKPNPFWKKGFYHIAMGAEVPIAIGYLDYKKKEGGIGKILYPTGNYEEDLKKIKDFYRDKTPRHPERFNLGEK
jgi:1-acyl-sn-glycerol-3-phosphate acyltransferase